jgi:hypothetical protein
MKTVSRRTFTLIHGTFAKNAPWVKPCSEFCNKLRECLDGEIVIESFYWEGNNSFKKRSHAAVQLREHLRSIDARHSGAQHFVIGHSHAGNVILQAISDPATFKLVTGIVCLSTPFIHVRPRRWSAVASSFWKLVFIPLIFTLLILPAYATDEGLKLLQRSMLAPLPAAFRLLFGISAFIGLLQAVIALPDRLSRLQKEFRDAVDCPCYLTHDQLLIVRTAADEASGFLEGLYVVTWLIGRSWRILERLLAVSSALSVFFLRTRRLGSERCQRMY